MIRWIKNKIVYYYLRYKFRKQWRYIYQDANEMFEDFLERIVEQMTKKMADEMAHRNIEEIKKELEL